MQFEVSETINGCDPRIALYLLDMQFRKVAGHVVRSEGGVIAQRIEASFGSVNRNSRATCSARSNGIKGILVAEVKYTPSFIFWIFFISGLFTFVGWLIPLVFYISQKRTVRSAVEDVFRRVKNECEYGVFPDSLLSQTMPTAEYHVSFVTAFLKPKTKVFLAIAAVLFAGIHLKRFPITDFFFQFYELFRWLLARLPFTRANASSNAYVMSSTALNLATACMLAWGLTTIIFNWRKRFNRAEAFPGLTAMVFASLLLADPYHVGIDSPWLDIMGNAVMFLTAGLIAGGLIAILFHFHGKRPPSVN
jgi:hypothetical protein